MRNKVVEHLRVNDPVNREEYEDFAGDDGTLDFFDKDTVPGHVSVVLIGFGDFPVALILESDPADFESLGDDTALGGADLVFGLASDENGETDNEHEKGKEIGGPETNILLHLGRGNRAETADIDHHVEYHVCCSERGGPCC